ncbi:MAG: lysophospholipid acyltransferase family protein [Polyangiaceae bacterium]
MIAARKSARFERWFAGQAQQRMARTFRDLRIAGLEETRALAARGPLLIVANHTSWWDALYVLVLSQRLLAVDGYAFMEGENLRRLPFFAKVGAFGVDTRVPGDAAAGVRHAARLLDRAGRVVWIFPQGRERPITERPPRFERGARTIARLARGARTVPLALRYEFGEDERPTAWASFGPPLPVEEGLARDAHQHQARAVEGELDRIERAVRAALPAPLSGPGAPSGSEVLASVDEGRPFVILPGRPPSAWAALATRILAWLTRPHRAPLPAGGPARR